MFIHELSPALFSRTREKLLRFIHVHGDRRITARAIRWLRALPAEMLEEEGNIVLIYTQNSKLLGCIAVYGYGTQESFLVVHQKAREQGIGTALTNAALSRLGKLYVRVAADNTASLKTCFTIGMVAFACVRGVTGKPTLWLAAGDWRKEDVKTI
ncbi:MULTISPECIES: GNAT family N-acetyltransferase [Aneurinibacillus]|jgi:ribosomal protein S18 acetylase RimI-like enzyme|uniref:GNAT family N-acetyltransferase n=1 Tax=Aneurinibacillus thermoaerophilus TaxID=143495 RepID=A0A1G7WRZ7_ANETH|nr:MULTISPECIES: GNAT family N-acetyltransferase [Aneurinibacillus]AMA73989.1 hypothetical protein ACH33_14855 [Aneurinibacillus sp. XH2]MED0676244.1 GNAT family N-acetyltransferase [Aneurinibacillus thermoaerophilus]MED0678176.1 GNAT family N-acetyltransferase [Aneurinibacillus thermoaerophilus]MED0737638.1 GNAT family N-acetyltransferase [Aneurinibacillus thermoaerophilus]MED0755630.1 GNAT family N-acetyltransferase [Aneurinibacillus thermoaerophilus]